MKCLIFAALATACFAISYDEFSKEMAAKTNQMQTHWRAGFNHYFRGWDLEDMKILMGTKMDYIKDAAVENVEVKDTLPSTFDCRQQWPKCTSIDHIRDQSTCGSCWAVSASEVATDRHCISSNAQNVPEISSEDLLECCSACGYGCQGGYPIRAMEYWQSTGIVTGGDYGTGRGCQPYEIPPCTHNCQESPTPKCSKPTCNGQYSHSYTSDKHTSSKSYYITANVGSIQQEIYSRGPVVCAFSVYQDFYNYKSGVYHHTTGAYVGGHAVKVLGWGTESNTPYWLVANSWNATWGMSGYFKIKRGSNECGFEAQCVAGMAKQ